jgi:hypothetical protein
LVSFTVSKAGNKFPPDRSIFSTMKREAAVSDGFMGAEFLDLSPEELIAKCREYRAEAERLAATTSIERRRGYIDLVIKWSVLADDIKMESGRPHKAHRFPALAQINSAHPRLR